MLYACAWRAARPLISGGRRLRGRQGIGYTGLLPRSGDPSPKCRRSAGARRRTSRAVWLSSARELVLAVRSFCSLRNTSLIPHTKGIGSWPQLRSTGGGVFCFALELFYSSHMLGEWRVLGGVCFTRSIITTTVINTWVSDWWWIRGLRANGKWLLADCQKGNEKVRILRVIIACLGGVQL